MSSGKEVLEELFDDSSVVMLVCVVAPKTLDGPVYEPLDDSGGVRCVGREVKVEIHGFLVSFEGDGARGGNGEG